MALLEQTIASIACEIPGATRVFHKFKLDFCCGGQQPLKDAIAQRNLDAALVVAELEQVQQLPSDETDWRTATPSALIDFILERFHALHRIQLPELVRLSRRVEHVHADKPGCPLGLGAHLANMLQELESHMQKEEQILFPMLKEGFNNPAQGPIAMMRFEHEQHGEGLDELMRLTNDITPPTGACVTWRALYTGLTQLREDLMQHIHLENNTLFANATAQA